MRRKSSERGIDMTCVLALALALWGCLGVAGAQTVAKPEAGRSAESVARPEVRNGVSGQAILALTTPKAKGKTLVLEAKIDLSTVKVSPDGVVQQPCILGAYVLGFRFDPKVARVLEVTGGATQEFSGKPVCTALEKANADGLLKFTAVQTSAKSPGGIVSVACLKVELKSSKDLKSLELFGDSLATAIYGVRDGKPLGPWLIPSGKCGVTIAK